MTNDSALLPFQKLDIYRVARELAIAVREANIRHTELRDQAGRASISAILSLSEGLPNDGPGMRRKYFTESNNSLHETMAAVDLAAGIGALDAAAASRIQHLGLRFKGMLWKLRAG